MVFSIAEETESAVQNLIKNGDFERFADGVPTNWEIRKKDNSGFEIVKAVEISEGVTKNAVKITTSADNPSNKTEFFYKDTVKI